MVERIRTALTGLTRNQRLLAGGLGALIVVVLVALLVVGGDGEPADRVETADASTSTSSTTSTSEPATTTTEPETTTSSDPSTTTTAAPSTTEPEPTTTSPPAASGPPRLADIEVGLTRVAGADAPIAGDVWPGDDSLWIAERAGRVRSLGAGGLSAPLVDISADTTPTGERGLLGMAISPDGGFLYLSYTDRGGDSRIDEFVIGGNGTVDAGSRRNVLAVDQPFANHNGGHIEFGPDGILHVGLGDGGDAGDPRGHAQNTETLLGSILRIDPRPGNAGSYGIPADNPFVGRAGRDEILVYGLRNPWRFSFDPAGGDLWVGDVGQNTVEEIDHLPAGSIAGANLGWKRFEGTRRFSDAAAPGAIGPVFEYGRSEGRSVTGGVVVHDRRLPDLAGAYLFSDFFNGSIRALRLGPGGGVADESRLGVDGGSPAAFVADGLGRVHVLSLTGDIFRLDPA